MFGSILPSESAENFLLYLLASVRFVCWGLLVEDGRGVEID